MAEKVTYKKRYRMVPQGREGKYTTVYIPQEVIQKNAEQAGLSVKEYVHTYRAVAQYNGFDGVLYTFEPIPAEEAA